MRLLENRIQAKKPDCASGKVWGKPYLGGSLKVIDLRVLKW